MARVNSRIGSDKKWITRLCVLQDKRLRHRAFLAESDCDRTADPAVVADNERNFVSQFAAAKMSPEGRSRPRHLVAGAVGFPHFRPETGGIEANHRGKGLWNKIQLTQKSSISNSPSFKTWRTSTRSRTSFIIGPKNMCVQNFAHWVLTR